jgi:hypothetical protein
VKSCGLIVVGHVQHFLTSFFNDIKFLMILKFLIVHRFNIRIVCAQSIQLVWYFTMWTDEEELNTDD